jgi:hypothetical protein
MATLKERPLADTPDQVLVLCRRIVQALADAGLVDEAYVFVHDAPTPLCVTERRYTAHVSLQPPRNIASPSDVRE